MTLKMTTAQVVETSVTVTNSSFQNYTHPDDHTRQTTDLFLFLGIIYSALRHQSDQFVISGSATGRVILSSAVC